MRKCRLSYRNCGRIMLIVILLNCLLSPVYGEPPTMPPENSTGSETKRYSDYDIDTLIEDLTTAAHEAIEQATAEGARAAALALLEREAEALQAQAALVREAEQLKNEVDTAKRAGVKNAIIAGLVCLIGGVGVGIAGTILISR